jgi:hypothetical protein
MEDDVIIKYRKIAAMISGATTDGERASAEKVAAMYRAKHPGVESAKLSSEQRAAPKTRGGFKPSAKSESYPEARSFVDDLLRDFVSDLGKKVKERGERVPNEEKTFADVEENVSVEADANSRTFTVEVKIPVSFLQDMTDKYGDAAVFPYSKAIGEAVTAEIASAWISSLKET